MKNSHKTNKIIKLLLAKYGSTFSEELGIRLKRNTPSVLFRWLCATLLFSAPISNKIALAAAQALFRKGWTTPQRMLSTTWKERVIVLNRSGYARYDEKTSRKLANVSRFLQDRYGGDLRKIRTMAKKDPSQERKLMMKFKGIGPAGADIFFREIQMVWKENIPFVDALALKAARKLGLPMETKKLAKLVSKAKFSHLLVALVRCSLDKNFSAIRV